MKRRYILILAMSLALPLAGAAEETPFLKVEVLGRDDSAAGVKVAFENQGDKPLKILKPVDGSEWGWHLPVYALKVVDAAGKELPMGERCGMSGLYSNLKWPEDYVIVIPPKGRIELIVRLARPIPATAKYKVSFSYTFDPTLKTVRPIPEIKYPDDIWVGTAASPEHETELGEAL